jgi:cytochrome c oxidase subunit 4
VEAHTSTHDDGHDDHGLAHVASKKILLSIGGILMILTIITVAATKVDFGSQMNLVVALLIATIKATLVAMFFMHLRYDKPFHTVVIAGALLAALLFVGFAFMDRNQYQRDICEEPAANCVVWSDSINAHAKAEAARAAAADAAAAGQAPRPPEQGSSAPNPPGGEAAPPPSGDPAPAPAEPAPTPPPADPAAPPAQP